MRKTYFETINNKQVFCILTEPQTSQKRIIIMSHGFRGSSIGPARSFVDFEKLIVKDGFSLLRFDQPYLMSGYKQLPTLLRSILILGIKLSY